MEFEWDEAKSRKNLEKHGIDFSTAREMFDGRRKLETNSDRGLEQRFATTAIVHGAYFTAVWTLRGARIRLISVRRARDAEKRKYSHLHGSGIEGMD
jgi:uncharacterized DUF497 family protein